VIKQRLMERLEDIKVADYRGNTPLQLASLSGFDDIVELLINAGCELNCRNSETDTPLMNAVEQGHLRVVELLLSAGASLHKPNAYGQGPLDRVSDKMEHSDKIRGALWFYGEQTARPLGDNTSRKAAARRDEETVFRILRIQGGFDNPKAMIAAARGGHDFVMQILLALGKANPDPPPITNNDYSTPILATIGQENFNVVRLLLSQPSFNPTRRYKGDTY